MRTAKERTHEKKRARKATSVRKTEESRTRRLANKAKRTEIISINSHAKIKIIDQETYVDGIKAEVVDGRIVPIESEVIETVETPVVVEEVKPTNTSKLRNIFKKW